MTATHTVWGHRIEQDAGTWQRVVTDDGVILGRIRKADGGWEYTGPQVAPKRASLWPSRREAVWHLLQEHEKSGLISTLPNRPMEMESDETTPEQFENWVTNAVAFAEMRERHEARIRQAALQLIHRLAEPEG